jgi:hypothetical protein
MAERKQPETGAAEELQLNRETIQDLSELDAQEARGGLLPPANTGRSGNCPTALLPSV